VGRGSVQSWGWYNRVNISQADLERIPKSDKGR